MATTEEQITCLAQQIHAMHTDVAGVQNALHKIRKSYGPASHQTAVMSRLQAPETRGTSAMTSVAQRFTRGEATENKPRVRSGEKNSESYTAFKMELHNWVGSLHDIVMKVMDTKEGRLMEQDVRKAGMSGDSGGFKGMEDTVPGANCMHQRRRSEELSLQP